MFTFRFPKKIIKFISWKHLMFFWYSYYKVLFFLGFIFVLSLGGFFWYQNLYRYRWDDAQKTEFLEKNFKEVKFNEKAFQDTVRHLKERQRLYEKTPSLSWNIFSGEAIEK